MTVTILSISDLYIDVSHDRRHGCHQTKDLAAAKREDGTEQDGHAPVFLGGKTLSVIDMDLI